MRWGVEEEGVRGRRNVLSFAKLWCEIFADARCSCGRCYGTIGLALASRKVAVCTVGGKRDRGRVFEERSGSEEVRVLCVDKVDGKM